MVGIEFTKKETKHLLISIIVVALVFGFNDGRSTFELGYWFANFLKILLIVGVSIFLCELVRKRVAANYGFSTEHRLWGVQRLSFRKAPTFPKTISFFGKKFVMEALPIGMFIALIIMIASNGLLYFAAVGSYVLLVKRIGRFGKKYVSITDYEEAKIAITGPLISIGIAIIFNFLNFGGIFDEVVLINSWLAFFNMLPLPGLDGFKVIAGSAPMYTFAMAFIICTVILIKLLTALPAIILAVALAIIFGIIFFYLRVYKR